MTVVKIVNTTPINNHDVDIIDSLTIEEHFVHREIYA